MCLCSCTGVSPTQRIVTQTVKVPIAVPCATAIPQKPEYNIPKLRASDSLYTKVQYILIDYELKTAYEIELEAALFSCK